MNRVKLGTTKANPFWAETLASLAYDMGRKLHLKFRALTFWMIRKWDEQDMKMDGAKE